MKKWVITLIIVLVGVPLLLGGALFFRYRATDEASVPSPAVVANGESIAPAGYEWHTSIFGGILYKDFYNSTTLEAQNVGSIEEAQIGVVFPEGYTSRVCVYTSGSDGQALWDGSEEEWPAFLFPESGDYVVQITCEKEEQDRKSYGNFTFRFVVSVDIDPVIEVSETSVRQGDVLAIRLRNVTEDTPPAATGDIGPIIFTASGTNSMTAYVPITHDREVGSYTIGVVAGGYSWDVNFTVTETDFGRQDLEIDTSSPQISEANSPAAYQQYRDKIYPVFDMVDENRYWEGPFTYPVPEDSRISTNYGLARYTNGSLSSRPHAGMDFAVPEGTEVWAPNAGVVVFSEYLLNTGNTIVMEHGGGLKSYYYHMSDRNVEVGDVVSQGDVIGWVGSTGYSTGAHLHYEVRIGDQSIDPAMMFEENSGFYILDRRDED